MAPSFLFQKTPLKPSQAFLFFSKPRQPFSLSSLKIVLQTETDSLFLTPEGPFLLPFKRKTTPPFLLAKLLSFLKTSCQTKTKEVSSLPPSFLPFSSQPPTLLLMPFYIAKGELSHVAIVRGPWSMVGVGEQCCTLCGSRREGQLVFNLIFITAGLIMWKETVELGSRQ